MQTPHLSAVGSKPIFQQRDLPYLSSGFRRGIATSSRLKTTGRDCFRGSGSQPRFGMHPEVLQYTTRYSPEASVELQKLLRRESLSIQDRDWMLVRAIRNEDVDVINTLHETGSDFNAKSTNLEYETNISFAIKQDKPKSVQALLAGGARIDVPEANGKLPIQAAIMHTMSPKIIALLLDNGARLKALTDREQQKLQILRKSMPEVEKLLEKQLCKAAASGDCDELAVLRDSGVNPKAIYNGWNAASLAAKYAQNDALRLLESKGCTNFFPELVIAFAKGMLDAKTRDVGSVGSAQKEVLNAFLMARPFNLEQEEDQVIGHPNNKEVLP